MNTNLLKFLRILFSAFTGCFCRVHSSLADVYLEEILATERANLVSCNRTVAEFCLIIDCCEHVKLVRTHADPTNKRKQQQQHNHTATEIEQMLCDHAENKYTNVEIVELLCLRKMNKWHPITILTKPLPTRGHRYCHLFHQLFDHFATIPRYINDVYPVLFVCFWTCTT
jgi:hypothetical protein